MRYPAEGAEDEPLDPEVLAALHGDDRGEERRLLGEFRRMLAEDEQALARAVEQSDAAAVARAAHRTRGASLVVGARDLALACVTLERAGRSVDLPGAREGLPALQREIARLDAWLARRLNRGA